MLSFSSSSKPEKGQGLVEYAIILALIAIVVISVMTMLGKKTCNTFNMVGNSLDGSTGSNCGTTSSGSVTAYSSYSAAQTAWCVANPSVHGNPLPGLDVYYNATTGTYVQAWRSEANMTTFQLNADPNYVLLANSACP